MGLWGLNACAVKVEQRIKKKVLVGCWWNCYVVERSCLWNSDDGNECSWSVF